MKEKKEGVLEVAFVIFPKFFRIQLEMYCPNSVVGLILELFKMFFKNKKIK